MVAPTVGDWLEGGTGTMSNPVWPRNNGLISASGFRWHWYRGTSPIPGATERRYQVVADDVGQQLKVVVTAIDQRFRDVGEIESVLTDAVTP